MVTRAATNQAQGVPDFARGDENISKFGCVGWQVADQVAVCRAKAQSGVFG